MGADLSLDTDYPRGGSALLAVLAMTAVGLLFLRPSLAGEELRTT